MSTKIACTFTPCRGTFANPSSLKRHINDVHVKDRKHRCERCSRSFTSSARLTDHMKKYGEKKHFCACGKGFTRQVDLQSHANKRFDECRVPVATSARTGYQTVDNHNFDFSEPVSSGHDGIRYQHPIHNSLLLTGDPRTQVTLHIASKNASQLAVSALRHLIQVCTVGLTHLHGNIDDLRFSTWLRDTELNLLASADAMLGYNGMADMAVACYSFVVETRHYTKAAGIAEHPTTAYTMPGTLSRLDSRLYQVLDWPTKNERASSDSHQLVVAAQRWASRIRHCVDALVTAGEQKLRTVGPAPGRRLLDMAGMFTEVYVYLLAWFRLHRSTERFLYDGVWHERLWEITES